MSDLLVHYAVIGAIATVITSALYVALHG